jgi:hypothetical protein
LSPKLSIRDLRKICLAGIYIVLENAKLLEKLRLSIARWHEGILTWLHVILSLSACTLKHLDLKVCLLSGFQLLPDPVLWEELDAMAGHNMVEAPSFKAIVDGDETEDFIGSEFQKVEEALVKPGWSSLRQVSFKVFIGSCGRPGRGPELSEALQFLPDKYLSHFSRLESVAFSYECNLIHDDKPMM